MANEWQKEQKMLSKNNPMFSVYRRFEGYRSSTIVFAERPEEAEIWGCNIFTDPVTFGRKCHSPWYISSPGRWDLDVGFDYWGCSVHFGRGHGCRLWRPVLNRFGGKMACSLSTQITLKSSGIVHNIEWNCYGLMCYIKYKVKMCLPAIYVI